MSGRLINRTLRGGRLPRAPRRPVRSDVLLGTAIVLLGDQPPVPAENRVRRDDACHLTQDPPAEFLTSHRESPALGVGQAKRSRTKMLPEDAILLPEIVDAIFLVASHPASQGQHEEVQSVGHGPEATWLRHGRHPRCFGDSLASTVFSHHTRSGKPGTVSSQPQSAARQSR